MIVGGSRAVARAGNGVSLSGVPPFSMHQRNTWDTRPRRRVRGVVLAPLSSSHSPGRQTEFYVRLSTTAIAEDEEGSRVDTG